ncbi:MAG: hypothetical protein CMO80_08855 [Verrucomicrobiales bacterium]|nr:hypothetical protein [Verrucomicrobiales bacterium]|tara:strand:+ start:1275 stop:1859 length:585 start_codon:yes stop_codon:yes gene_type:complete
MLESAILPLGGAIFAGWDVGSILMVYWAENVVVGAYNLLKFCMAQSGTGKWNATGLPLIPFFIVHYGIFCTVHGAFVMMLGNRGFPNGPFAVLGEVGSKEMILPVLGLVISHGVSFVQNYVIRGEYKTTTPGQLMAKPYGRIIVLHVVILFGGFVTMLLKSALPVLALLVIIKIAIDLAMHTASHRRDDDAVPS